MNFLAHLYLSGNNNEVLIGNFIADAVKGKKAILQFPEQVQKGIIIHRDIDFYMDTHPIVKQGMSRLRENYPKFSGVIMDIFYDHFLAKNWVNYSKIDLEKFTHQVYKTVGDNKELLVGKAKMMYPYMKRDNWLLSYQTVDGIQVILERMTKRIDNKVLLNKSVTELQNHYQEYDEEFTRFFDEIYIYLKSKYDLDFVNHR